MSYQNLDSPSDAPAKNCCQESRPVYVFGFLTLAAGIAIIVIFVSYLPGYVQNMADEKVADKYVPKEGSSDFDDWLRNDDPGDPLEYKTFWFYNLSNAYDVIYNRSAPIVTEVGPFVFQMHVHKLKVDTSVPKQVSYIEWLRYSWVADPVSFNEVDGSVTTYTSLDPETTYITMFEPAILASLYQVEHNPWNISLIGDGHLFCEALHYNGLQCLNFLANLPSKITGPGSDALLSTRTANQWLGCLPNTAPPSPFLDYLNSVLGKNSSYDHNWAYVYNDSKYTEAEALSEWKMQTVRFDRADLSKAMSLLQWNGNQVLLNNKAAGSIAPLNFLNDGRLFSGWGSDINFADGWYLLPQYTHPGLRQEEPLDFWLSLGARSVRLVYNKSVELQGVKGYRYEVDYGVFDNTTENFNMFGSTINGLVNVGPIQNYAPAFVTHPHFLDYPNILEQFNLQGVTPANPKKHRTFADVDPTSGLVFNAAERLQVNIITPELDFAAAGLPGYGNIAGGNLLPVLWLEQRSQGTPDDMKDLKQLQSVHDIKRYLVIGGSLGGAVVLVIALLLLRRGSNLSQIEQGERLARPTPGRSYGTSEASRPLTAPSEFGEGN